MNTLLTVIIILSALTASQAQIKGIPVDKAVSWENVEDLYVSDQKGKLIKIELEDEIAYFYIFELKAKGYYDALKELEYILNANGINRDPDVDDTYFRPNVDKKDYNKVVSEIRMETGWIQEAWSVYDGEWKIFILGNANAISVGSINYESPEANTEYIWRSDVFRNVEEAPRKVNDRALFKERAESDNYTEGMGGKGINFSLAGRNPVSFPKPDYNVQEGGTVVVTIRVNREGVVTYAEAGARGTNTLNKELLEAAKKAALKARFNRSEAAAFTQQGTITYHFVLQ